MLQYLSEQSKNAEVPLRMHTTNTLAHNNARQSNFELLRIVSMLMIILHHFAVHGQFDLSVGGIPIFNALWLLYTAVGGKTGVCLFVMLSGYFSIRTTRPVWGKAARLWVQVLTYSAVLSTATALKSGSFGVQTLVYYILPVCVNDAGWWFVRPFFLLLLFSPFLNRLLTQLDKRAFRVMLLLFLTLFSILPFALRFGLHYTIRVDNFVWFVFLYALGAYLQMRQHKEKPKRAVCFLSAAVLTAGVVLAVLLLCRLRGYNDPLSYFSNSLNLPNDPLYPLLAVLLFLGFEQIPLRQSKTVNFAASTIFGVYLLHDHPVVRTFLWQDLFRNAAFQSKPYLAAYALLVSAAVLIGCGTVDGLRQLTLERLFRKPLTRLIERAAGKIGKLPFFRTGDFDAKR